MLNMAGICGYSEILQLAGEHQHMTGITFYHLMTQRRMKMVTIFRNCCTGPAVHRPWRSSTLQFQGAVHSHGVIPKLVGENTTQKWSFCGEFRGTWICRSKWFRYDTCTEKTLIYVTYPDHVPGCIYHFGYHEYLKLLTATTQICTTICSSRRRFARSSCDPCGEGVNGQWWVCQC